MVTRSLCSVPPLNLPEAGNLNFLTLRFSHVI
jgi:hypothetical protein